MGVLALPTHSEIQAVACVELPSAVKYDLPIV